MREFNRQYKIIVSDIDDTIVYGFITRLMDVSWRYTRCVHLSNILNWVQVLTKFYRVNSQLAHILNNYEGTLVFLTARSKCKATRLLLNRIIKRDYELIELASYNPTKDKIEQVSKLIDDNQKHRLLMFEDDKDVRWALLKEGYHAINPMNYREELIS